MVVERNPVQESLRRARSGVLLSHLLALSLLLALSNLGASCASASASKDPVDDVREDVYHGRYDQAVREAASLHEKHPDDPRYASLHQEASVAYLIDQGRQETFKDRDLEALTIFRQAQEMDPSSQEAADWIHKTLRKLSRTWLERGLELHATGKLQDAVEAYEKSLEYVPGDASALNGLGDAVIQINFREGMGKQYFEEGMRALSAYWLDQAKARFQYSKKYEPGDDKVGQRSVQVNALLAQQRVTVARGFEQESLYGAARNEYRLAVALDPSNVDAKAGLDRCTSEWKAGQQLEKARMEIVRNRLDRAQELVDEGAQLTVAQKDLFEGARAKIEQARLERTYQEALTLERDYRFEQAIAAYANLLKDVEYYKDAITRKETLEEYVKLAGELYANAEKATTDEEKLDNLRKINVFWPEYKDVPDQLAKLEGPPETEPKTGPPEKKVEKKPVRTRRRVMPAQQAQQPPQPPAQGAQKP
jgi:tetratricopeptide (TPR) repeat protein